MNKRVIYGDNGVLTDYSVSLDDYYVGDMTFTYVTGQDYIYIGSLFPFNHLYFKFNGTNINSNSATISVQYWDSKTFRDAIDVLDETSVSGASFAQSGFVTWSTNKTYGWIMEDTNYGGNSVEGLTSLNIYDLYWVRFSFSANLSSNVKVSWLGQKFTTDNDLKDEHAELTKTTFLNAFESGKTDWEAQHIRATELIISDLVEQGIIIDQGQILKREDFKLAAVKKVAQLVYTNMGKSYYDDRDNAKNEYVERINKVIPKIDLNINGRFDSNEYAKVGRLVR